jgi:type I restriction enzyme S subunit
MSFPLYPEYKDSGVEWLGEVPVHWGISPLKRMLDIQNGSDHKHIQQDEGYPVIGSGGVFAYASEYVYDGESILLGRKGTIDRPLYVNEKFWTVDTMYWSKIRSGTLGKFAYYTALGIPFFYYSTNTALPSMTKGTLDTHLVCAPSEQEQIAIAAFLDRETTKIDTLIAEQEQLIALLKEKRQAVISHVVTKGLDPNVKMKDSGIEWLGEVPGHWDVKRLKFLCKVQTGDKDTVNAVDDGEYPFFVRSQTVERINSYTADCEAVLTAGDGVGVGKVYHYINGRFDYHQRVYMMSRFSFVTGRFFFHYLSTMFQKVALDGGAKSTVDSLRMPIFMNFQFTVPPVNEQEEIIKKIDRVNSEFDELANEAARGIELLKERRSALISAAVTGKIDVTQMRREIA